MLVQKQKWVCVPSIVEAGLVLTVLIPATIFSGGRLADWLSCIAVFLTFLHSQAAFNLAHQSLRLRGEGDASTIHTVMFLVKEGFWVLTFLALGSYPLLLSSVLFATYPFWRGKIRGLNPSRVSSHSALPVRS
jgi:hypothetical protein